MRRSKKEKMKFFKALNQWLQESLLQPETSFLLPFSFLCVFGWLVTKKKIAQKKQQQKGKICVVRFGGSFS